MLLSTSPDWTPCRAATEPALPRTCFTREPSSSTASATTTFEIDWARQLLRLHDPARYQAPEDARILPLDAKGLDGADDIRVSDIQDTAAARFCESVESGHSDQDQSAMIARDLQITEEPVRVDSQCKYAIVARGEAQIYLRLPTRKDYREKIWDHAAAMTLPTMK